VDRQVGPGERAHELHELEALLVVEALEHGAILSGVPERFKSGLSERQPLALSATAGR